MGTKKWERNILILVIYWVHQATNREEFVTYAEMVELVDTRDLKSLGYI